MDPYHEDVTKFLRWLSPTYRNPPPLSGLGTGYACIGGVSLVHINDNIFLTYKKVQTRDEIEIYNNTVELELIGIILTLVFLLFIFQ